MTTPAPDINIRWVGPNDLERVADFISEVVRLDPRYISHGEIQTGLSKDGHSWVGELDRFMRDDFDSLEPDRRAVAVWDGQGNVIGAAVVLTVVDDRARFAVIEDIAVSPKARSSGIGQALVSFIEDNARTEGIEWAFLESGLDNHNAHSFFERQDYRPLSKVFGKRL